MSLWHIAWNYLWNRKLTTFLTVLSVALGVALITTVLTLEDETRRRFEEEGKVFDVVAGAKGSPLQLVLSSVYFMDRPTGNIRLADYEEIKQDEDVAAAFPISLGDTYEGSYRIVGTIPELMDYAWIDTRGNERKPFQLASGRIFKAPMEAVVGGLTAQQTGLKIGQTFVGGHPGQMHEDAPYKVVGILKIAGTPMDRAIYTRLDSVWELHKEEAQEAATDPHRGQEITAVLISLHSPALQFTFERKINDNYNVMAARPIIEISNFYNQFLGKLKAVLIAVGFLVVVISALSIMIGLYLAIVQRRRDLAIMRALGASAGEIFGAVLIEAFWVTLIGIAAGWVLSSVVTAGVGMYLKANFGMIIQPFGTTPLLVSALALVGIVGIVAGFLPALQAYRTDVARDLAAV